MLLHFLGTLLSRQLTYINRILMGSLVAGMAVLFMLGLIVSILISLCIGIGIYISYTALVAYGVPPLKSALIVDSGLLLITAALIAVAAICIIKVKNIPKRMIMFEYRAAEQVNKVIEAFIDGFNTVPGRK